ncbi:YbdD/YjiX family protein [Streptomyces ginkgonis]|uniref:YbdD/YjiX family protein n=1 Tax=Streptomyces ginkgonis TaxID=1812259 RepID=UPI002176E6C1|nr:YbdD/YjiX family protein [Streptomyces ginkgonis]
MNGTTAPATRTRVAGTARRVGRWLRWYLREVTGESAYDRYTTRARAQDPAVRVLTRREFERMRMDARAADPQGGARCC